MDNGLTRVSTSMIVSAASMAATGAKAQQDAEKLQRQLRGGETCISQYLFRWGKIIKVFKSEN